MDVFALQCTNTFIALSMSGPRLSATARVKRARMPDGTAFSNPKPSITTADYEVMEAARVRGLDRLRHLLDMEEADGSNPSEPIKILT